jgi:hypothetical protein
MQPQLGRQGTAAVYFINRDHSALSTQEPAIQVLVHLKRQKP